VAPGGGAGGCLRSKRQVRWPLPSVRASGRDGGAPQRRRQHAAGYRPARQAGAGAATAGPDTRGRRDSRHRDGRARTGAVYARDGPQPGTTGTGCRGDAAGIARKHALHHSRVQSPASTAIRRVVERRATRADDLSRTVQLAEHQFPRGSPQSRRPGPAAWPRDHLLIRRAACPATLPPARPPRPSANVTLRASSAGGCAAERGAGRPHAVRGPVCHRAGLRRCLSSSDCSREVASIRSAPSLSRRRWATSWRDARDEIGAGWGLRVVCSGSGGRRRGGRCMLGVACRPSSPVDFGPFEAVVKFGAGVPVAGHARCCCERVCQSPD
jgi:hypothetical protein